MLFSRLFKFTALVAMASAVYAFTEDIEDQPTKLLGGTLRRPETCGYKVSSNAEIHYHYRARVWGEEEFYEDTYSGEPHKSKLGRDKLMKGLEQGIHGMCEGEVRRLIIPASLAYGEYGLPHLVPGNSAIVYEVEILNVNSPFHNPWFWLGLTLLVTSFLFHERLQKFLTGSGTSDYLKAKEAVKKNE